MGGRVSRVASIVPKSQTAAPSVKPEPPKVLAVKDSLPTDAEKDELLEKRDPDFETKIHELAGSIVSTETVFVPGSDPVSAEAKRKARREVRQKMLAQRISTATFKQILLEHGRSQNLSNQEAISQLATKYEVDGALLAQMLKYYRFPPLYKRYDGYIEADRWD